jgi:hypothetical protein
MSPHETTRLGKRWSLLKGLAFGTGSTSVRCLPVFDGDLRGGRPGIPVWLQWGASRYVCCRCCTGRAVAPGMENLISYLWKHYRGILSPLADAGAAETAAAVRHAEETQRCGRALPAGVRWFGPWTLSARWECTT